MPPFDAARARSFLEARDQQAQGIHERNLSPNKAFDPERARKFLGDRGQRRMVERHEAGIPESRGWLEKIVSGLDYLGNITRSGIRGALVEEESALMNAIGAAMQDKFTTPEQLKDILTEKFGAGKVRFGKDDGEFQYGDIADFVLDVGVDLATDPLTYMSFGLNKLAQMGTKGALKTVPIMRRMGESVNAFKMLKGSKRGREALNISDDVYKLAAQIPTSTKRFKFLRQSGVDKTLAKYIARSPQKLLKDAKSWQVAANISKPVIGGMYGFSASNPEDSAARKALNFALGATAVYGGSKILPAAGKELKKSFNKLTDYYGETTRGIGKRTQIHPKAIRAKAEKLAKRDMKLRNYGTDSASKIKQLDDFESLTNLYMNEIINPLAYSEAIETSAEAMLKKNLKARDIVAGRIDALAGLKGPEIVTFDNLMRQMKGIFTDRRLKAFEEAGISKDVLRAKQADPEIFNKITKRINDEMTGEYDSYLRGAFDETSEIHKILKDQDKGILKAVDRFTAHNKKIINTLNRETPNNLVGIKWHIDDVFQGEDFRNAKDFMDAFSLVPKKSPMYAALGHNFDEAGKIIDSASVPAHIAMSDPKAMRQIEAIEAAARKETDDLITTTKINTDGTQFTFTAPSELAPKIDGIADRANKQIREVLDTIEITPEGLESSYRIYADRMGRAFLDKKERQSLRIMAQARFMDPKQPFFKHLEFGLKIYDRMTNFMKSNMLMFSTTWLKNNYWDNMTKAYAQSGLMTGLKTGLRPALFMSPLNRDIGKIVKGEISPLKGDPLLRHALEDGVFENPMFSILNNQTEDSLKFITGNNSLAETIGSKGIKNLSKKGGAAVGKAMQSWQNLLSRTTGQLGQVLEGTARFTTYKNTYNSLKKAGAADEIIANLKKLKVKNPAEEADKQLRKIAADITKNTFFDYQDISHLERAVFRRIIPFYSFYSKNLPYWVDVATDIHRIGRLSDIDKFRRNLGREPNELEREGLSTWINQNAPRVLGKSRKGTQYGIFPYISSYDAIQMLEPKNLKKQLEEKLSPYIKTPAELINDQDWFTGSFVFPSSALTKKDRQMGKKGKKYIFNKGFKYAYIDQWAKKKWGKDASIFGVELDKRGNPIARSDNFALVEKIFSTVFPMGLVDQFTGAVGKIREKGQSPVNVLTKSVTPLDPVIQSIVQAQHLKRQRKRSRKLAD